MRGVLAENLIASMLDLELASGNDAMASHSDIRKSAKLMLQFLPGTDFIFSGYSSMPREDNLFGGGNFDTEDLDDYNVLQRDMHVDGGLRPVTEEEALAVRRRAAEAVQAVFAELGLPPITEAEVEAAVDGAQQRGYARARRDRRPRSRLSLPAPRPATGSTSSERSRAAAFATSPKKSSPYRSCGFRAIICRPRRWCCPAPEC